MISKIYAKIAIAVPTPRIAKALDSCVKVIIYSISTIFVYRLCLGNAVEKDWMWEIGLEAVILHFCEVCNLLKSWMTSWLKPLQFKNKWYRLIICLKTRSNGEKTSTLAPFSFRTMSVASEKCLKSRFGCWRSRVSPRILYNPDEAIYKFKFYY